MAKLSYINTDIKQDVDLSFSIPTDESVGAILFDISGFDNPFNGYPLLYNSFKDNSVQCIKNLDEAQLLGIVNDGFLNGLLYYHLSQFYDYVGADQSIYLMFADCSKDWGAIQLLHQTISGKAFQIGVWTSQPIWKMKSEGTLGFTPLIKELQSQADEINGKVGVSTHTMAPVSIILSANTSYIDGETFSFKSLPDAIELNCPKVSVLMLQNGSTEVKNIQSNNPLNAPVGAIGMVMGILALSGAEESIAAVNKFDLNKNEAFNYPEWGVSDTGVPINIVNRIWANIISERGYIVPIDYEGEEASYFLSSDQTLSEGDYSSIANNRIIHKCRRAICTALIPYVNGHHIYDYNTKALSLTAKTNIASSIYTILDSIMINKSGQSQLSSRAIEFIDSDDLLESDSISIKMIIEPANYSGEIIEEVSHDVVS